MSFFGNLDDLPLGDVLQTLGMQRATGMLSIVAKSGVGRLILHEGRIGYASSTNRPRLGLMLVEEGLVTLGELNDALQEQLQATSDQQRSLGRVLVERGLVEAEELRHACHTHTREIVAEFLSWGAGFFYFEKDLGLLGNCDIEQFLEVRAVLIDAARAHDEARHHGLV